MSKDLTETQREVLYLYNVEGLTTDQIATRRGTSKRAARKMVQKLREKGLLNLANVQEKITPPPCQPKRNFSAKKFWRLHNLHFVCNPYYFTPKYHRVIEDLGNEGVYYRKWLLKFHKDMVELQLRSDRDFRAGDKWACLRKMREDLHKTLFEVGNKYGFRVFKEGKCNVRLVNQHLALTNSELSQEYEENHLLIRDSRDGKVYFEIDNSLGMREHEYRHPVKAVQDSEVFEPFFNSLRHHFEDSGEVFTLDKLFSSLQEVVVSQQETTRNIVLIQDVLAKIVKRLEED